MIQKRLDEINRTGLNLDLGRIIDDAFDTYKKIALNVGLAYILLFLFIGFVTFGIISTYFVAEELMKEIEYLKETNILPLNYFIGIMGYSTIIIIILTPISAGILKMCKTADTIGTSNLNDLFYYYKIPYFLNLTILAFIMQFLTVSITYLFDYVFVIQIIGGVLQYIIYFLFILTIPLITFANQNPIEAIKNSAKLTLKNPFTFLLGMIIAYFFAFLGIIILCIGLFFTMPFIEAMRYTLYKHTLGFQEEIKEWEQIGTNEE